LTVALVPTGTKAGVAICPCGVSMTPVRPARPPSRRVLTVKENDSCARAASTPTILYHAEGRRPPGQVGRPRRRPGRLGRPVPGRLWRSRRAGCGDPAGRAMAIPPGGRWRSRPGGRWRSALAGDGEIGPGGHDDLSPAPGGVAPGSGLRGRRGELGVVEAVVGPALL